MEAVFGLRGKDANLVDGWFMTTPHYSEPVLDVTGDPSGGFVAERLSETIVAQAETWNKLRANVRDALEAYFFDGPEPHAIRLHVVRDEVFQLQ